MAREEQDTQHKKAVQSGAAREGWKPRLALPTLKSSILHKINQARQQLTEGEELDPWVVIEAFNSYQEEVFAEMMEAREMDARTFFFAEKTPTEQAILDSILRVREAFEIVSYPYAGAITQKTVFAYIEAYQLRDTEPFTLTEREKEDLQIFTRVLGIPDDPQQFEYSFASLPPPLLELES